MNLNKKNEKRALTIKEAAEYACVSDGTVKNWISKRILPFEELPGRGEGTQRFIRIRFDDLKVFLDLNYCKPNQNKKVKIKEELILLPQDG